MQIRGFVILSAFGFGLVSICSPLQAGLIGVDIYDNTSYQQTSAAAPTTPSSYFFDIGGNYASSGDFDSASATFPGNQSPFALTIDDPTLSFGNGVGNYTSLSSLHQDFGFGTYDITASNSVTSASQTGVLDYTADYFTSAIPALSATTWAGLNGLDPSTALNIGFNSFSPDPSVTLGLTFFTIYDLSGNVVFTDGFLDPSTTSLNLPVNTLSADTTYGFELDFSDRLNGYDSTDGVFTEEGFDVRTDGSFTTGAIAPSVPEPCTTALFAFGLLGLAGAAGNGGCSIRAIAKRKSTVLRFVTHSLQR